MTNRIIGASVAVLLLAGSLTAAEGLRSGPQVGSTKLPVFNPLNVTGAQAGSRACQV
jgi:hypothetical protein